MNWSEKMRLKHNKKRNTAFLYESLIRQVVLSSVKRESKRRDVVLSLIKENFAKDTEIKKELDLYKALIETKNISLRKAEKLLNEIKKEHAKIDKKKLFKEQSALIKTINRNVSKDVFSNFVPNYKSLATISQIFDEDVSGKKRVVLEEDVIKYMILQTKRGENKQDISNLQLKTFISKFNDTYDFLLEEQKDLLNKYILSFLDNGLEFKIYLNEEIDRLRKIVISSKSMEEVQSDSLMKEKINSVLALIEGFKENPINENMLKSVLSIQTLTKEMQS